MYSLFRNCSLIQGHDPERKWEINWTFHFKNWVIRNWMQLSKAKSSNLPAEYFFSLLSVIVGLAVKWRASIDFTNRLYPQSEYIYRSIEITVNWQSTQRTIVYPHWYVFFDQRSTFWTHLRCIIWINKYYTSTLQFWTLTLLFIGNKYFQLINFQHQKPLKWKLWFVFCIP
jgi:hypothetical protein